MYVYFLISFCIAFVDLLTKFLIRSHLQLGEAISVCPFFNLVYVLNKGISFSMLTEVTPLILTVIACLICAGVCYFLIKEKNKFSKICLALVLGGAIGNIADRIYLGAVVDFMDFYIGKWHWPAFNIADSAICIGVILLIYQSVFMKEKK